MVCADLMNFMEKNSSISNFLDSPAFFKNNLMESRLDEQLVRQVQPDVLQILRDPFRHLLWTQALGIPI